MDYRNFFKNKKITLLGLGLLGRGVGDAEFLAECGAELIITDLKKEEDLKSSLDRLEKFKNITYVLGEHRLEDFSAKGGSASGGKASPDFILKAANVPLDSPFIAEAHKNGIPIKQDASWFAELAGPDVVTVGVTGTRGKSTTTELIYEILKTSGKRVYLGGNVRGVATLPLLRVVKDQGPEIKDTTYVVMELDSWQLQGFGDAGTSPHVAVFTNFLVDHLNYYKGDQNRYFTDKAHIFEFQKKGDYLIVGKDVFSIIQSRDLTHRGTVVVVGESTVPADWSLKLLGEHNRLNASFAIAAARALGVEDEIIKKAVESFSGVPGRLEFIREVLGVKYFNDTTATTPDATLAALAALREEFPLAGIVLIGGGTDKELDFDEYVKVVPQSVKALILFKGTASDKIIDKLEAGSLKLEALHKDVLDMKTALELGKKEAKEGDTILLSPAAASFGLFKNEYDRGDQFNEIVRSLQL